MILGDYSGEELSKISTDNLDDLTLEESGELSIYIDSLTRNPIIYPGYVDLNNSHYFYYFNEAIRALDIYDLSTKQRIKHLLYPQDGPFAVSSKSFPKIISMDSIFLFSRGNSTLILTDTTSREKARYPMTISGKDLNVNMVQTYNVFQNKAIIAYQPPFYDPQLKDTSNYVVVDLNTLLITKSLAKRPKSVTSFLMRGSDAMPRICFGDNGDVINFFGAGPLVIKSNISSPKVEYYILRSKLIPEPYKEPKNDGKNILEKNEFMSDTYFMMCYDKYNHYYYLMCTLAEDPVDSNGDLKTVDDEQLSIIIADSLFRKRGEVLLPRNKYFRSMFVTKDGLMVSTANPKNPNFKEDSLTYTLFKPVSIN